MTFRNVPWHPAEIVLDPWHRTPLSLEEWREGERFGATHLQDWCETKAMVTNRCPSPYSFQWHQDLARKRSDLGRAPIYRDFSWYRDPANRREERG